jgi:RNA polymerase sigma factor FliA
MELAQLYQGKEWQGEGDSPTKDQLVLQYLPYVKNIVQRIHAQLPMGVDEDDLTNVGVIGLIDAIDRYDPTRGTKFTTYAAFRIRGAVMGELRSRDVVSRTSRSKIRELQNTYADLEFKKGGEVQDSEVADAMGIEIDEFYQIRKMASMSFVSFEEMWLPSREERDDVIGFLLGNGGEDPFQIARIKELRNATAEAIEQLPEKEKMVISLYYWDELTMKEIGKVLELTESRVSQLHSQAVVHLRNAMKKKGLVGD